MAALRGDIRFRYLKQFFLVIYCSFKKGGVKLGGVVVFNAMAIFKTPLLLDTPLRIKSVRLAAGRWFSWYTPPIKQDSHGIKHHNSLNIKPYGSMGFE
jgi:hypothetical protein